MGKHLEEKPKKKPETSVKWTCEKCKVEQSCAMCMFCMFCGTNNKKS